MKNFPGTVKILLVLATAFILFFTLQILAKDRSHADGKPVFEVCITEPVMVSDIPKFKNFLKKLNKENYRVRIEVPGESPFEAGDLPECKIDEKMISATGNSPIPSASPAGGGQVTQRLRLNAKQLREISNHLGDSSAPTPTPTPKP